MPYFKPASIVGAQLFDLRKATPTANVYVPASSEPEIAAYKQISTNAISTSGISGAWYGSRIAQDKILFLQRAHANTSIYNTGTKTFTNLGNVFTGTNCQNVCEFNHYALSVEGYPGNTIQFFTDGQSTWLYNNLDALPKQCYLGAVFQANGIVYNLGGTINTGLGYGSDANVLYSIRGIDLHLTSNTATNPPGWVSPWATLSPPPVAMCSPVGCVSWDKSSIHIFYYENSTGHNVSCWYEYSISNDSWTTHAASLTGAFQYAPIQLPNGDFVGFTASTNSYAYFRTSDQSFTDIIINSANFHSFIYDEQDNICYAQSTAANQPLYAINPFQMWAVNYGI